MKISTHPLTLMSKPRSKSKTVPKKKERERMLVTFSTKKRNKHAKITKPPTKFAMSKSRSSSKTVPKKKRERTLVTFSTKKKERNPHEKNQPTHSP
jgi:hypothetical protein